LLYYSTFTSGLSEVIKKELKHKVSEVKVLETLDGLIVYETSEDIKTLKAFRFLNNTFLLLFYGKENSIKGIVKKIIGKNLMLASITNDALGKSKTFRVIISEENQLVKIDRGELERLENVFTRVLHLEVDRAKPDAEVWILLRSEGTAFVGVRLTKNPNYEKILRQGELRPELAHMMCLLSDPDKNDVILDPFAGYGSIPFECVKSFPVRRIIAGEKDKKLFNNLQEKVRKENLNVVLGRWDALRITSLNANSVDKIITDPPWGFYDTEIYIHTFYGKMVAEFLRVLKPGGIIVLLTAQKELLEDVIKQHKELTLENKYDVLVSGKKAGIYKILNKEGSGKGGEADK